MMATLQDIIIMYIMEIWWIESWICSDYNMSSQGAGDYKQKKQKMICDARKNQLGVN